MKSTGYIMNGVYYVSENANDPISPADGFTEGNITYKSYSHDRQREDHRYELIQPYVGGKPNPEFIQMYPEESKQYGFH